MSCKLGVYEHDYQVLRRLCSLLLILLYPLDVQIVQGNFVVLVYLEILFYINHIIYNKVSMITKWMEAWSHNDFLTFLTFYYRLLMYLLLWPYLEL